MSAITPKTNLKLLKCPIELSRSNQLTFSNATAQYNYFNSLPSLSVDDFTYQRKDYSIRYGACVDDILEYNYVMYRNDEYSDKWYYAYINNMTWINDNCTQIEISTDVFQTFQFDITYMNSFVEREHVSDDTIGKHTIPEGLETGEYIINSYDSELYSEYAFLMNASETSGGENLIATNVNGIWMAGGFYAFDNMTSLATVIQSYAGSGRSEAIGNIYIVPKFLLGTNTYNTRWNGKSSPTLYTKSVTKQTTLDTYSVKNNKTLCYPYNYLCVTNNNGSSNILHYEKFNSNTCEFSIGGTATVGASIICIPQDYKISSGANQNEMLICGKFPTCSWSEDAYTNWLTQNGVNIGGIKLNAEEAGYVSGIGSLLIGGTAMALGNPYGVGVAGGGVGQILSTMQTAYQHSMIADSFRGNINGGDFLTASGRNGFIFYKMSIDRYHAKCIDDFFSMYGYKVNSVKVPNITGRRNWNYVKTIGANIHGYFPEMYLNELKTMFNNGLTLWHSASTFLDYSQNNSIV